MFHEATSATANLLRLTLDPDTITFRLNINGAGDPFTLETVDLDAQLAAQEIPAYGRLLLGVLDGDATFSIRDDEAEEAWRVIEPITAYRTFFRAMRRCPTARPSGRFDRAIRPPSSARSSRCPDAS